ncbi:MAG: biotin--[acetyl-CoA-carboxylase] ligase, partial [Ghiorsea sp.]
KEALRQAENGANEGLVIVAEAQTAGKGRLGRKWHTIDHALAMTVLLRPDLKPVDVPKLSLVTAVALHDALSSFAPEIGIKWPNDLLIHGKKISGILTEMRCKQQQVQAVVLGIGININAPQHGWAADITHPAVDLQSVSSFPVDKTMVLQAVLESLDKWYTCFLQQGFAPIRQAWWAAHLASGKQVSVYDGERYIQGIAHALAEDGALSLLVNGVEQRIIAGDVSILEE